MLYAITLIKAPTVSAHTFKSQHPKARSSNPRPAVSTVNPQTKHVQTKNICLISSGEFPMDLGIPPLKIKNMLESNPLKSRFLVRGVTVIKHQTKQKTPRREVLRSGS